MNTMIREKKEFSQGIIDLISPSLVACKKQLGIHTFGYRRFLPNGKSFGFSDNKIWNQICLEHFTGVSIKEYENDLKQCVLSHKEHFMRKGIPDPNSPFLKALHETNVWNTLSLYRKSKNNSSIEAFFFGATRDDVNIIEVYMDRLDYIHSWTTVIQHQLENCFNKTTNPYFLTTVTDPSCLDSLQHFLMVDNNALRLLSERELEIATLLAKGYKRRYIALKLNMSVKTVDANLEHMKKKTNMASKIQFLKFLNGSKAQEVLKLHEIHHMSY